MQDRRRCCANGCFKNTRDIHSFFCEFHYDLVPLDIRRGMAFCHSKKDYEAWQEFVNVAVKIIRDFERKRERNRNAFFIGSVM